jgi:hypothetical protein
MPTKKDAPSFSLNKHLSYDAAAGTAFCLAPPSRAYRQRSSSQRVLIDTDRNKVFAKRDGKGQFKRSMRWGVLDGGSTPNSQDEREVGSRRTREIVREGRSRSATTALLNAK